MRPDMRVVRVVARLLIPLILVFAFYVQFHGDYGPGGGFQAGVIFASAIILYALVYDTPTADKILHPRFLRVMMSLGLLLYILVGLACLYQGGAFLEYDVLTRDAVHGQHRGIFWVELGVGTTVAAVMISVVLTFFGYSEHHH